MGRPGGFLSGWGGVGVVREKEYHYSRNSYVMIAVGMVSFFSLLGGTQRGPYSPPSAFGVLLGSLNTIISSPLSVPNQDLEAVVWGQAKVDVSINESITSKLGQALMKR